MQRILYQAHVGIKFASAAVSDGEDSRVLFVAWKELGPLLASAPEDGEWQAALAMRDLLHELRSNKPPATDLRAWEDAHAYRAHCCKAGCQSDYLLYLKDDVTTAVANATRLGVGLGAVCAHVVDNLNAILKRAYNEHNAWGKG